MHAMGYDTSNKYKETVQAIFEDSAVTISLGSPVHSNEVKKCDDLCAVVDVAKLRSDGCG